MMLETNNSSSFMVVLQIISYALRSMKRAVQCLTSCHNHVSRRDKSRNQSVSWPIFTFNLLRHLLKGVNNHLPYGSLRKHPPFSAGFFYVLSINTDLGSFCFWIIRIITKTSQWHELVYVFYPLFLFFLSSFLRFVLYFLTSICRCFSFHFYNVITFT